MHSAEPIQPSVACDSSNQPAASEAWRAEVASRVSSYRARRTRKSSDEDFPAFDFGPAAEAQSLGAPGTVTQSMAEPRRAKTAERNAFDTNYYRRLNAESMAPSPRLTMGSAAAIVPAPEPEADFAAADETDLTCEPTEDVDCDPAFDLELRPTVTEDSYLDRYRIAETDPQPPVAPPVPQTQGNLIVFRRPLLEPPLVPPPSRDELAEPMNNRPRILEVPEDIMPAVQGSLFPEIQLDADDQEASSNLEPDFEVPLPVALVSERLIASLVDLGMVGLAGLIFAGIAWFGLPDVPHAKPFWMALGAVTVLLWAVYQHLFLLYAGRTPGMSMRGLRLSTFDGDFPQWDQRTRRARYMCISLASVALGFIWAMVDEDTLCWHDRISRTFPTMD